ncbi:ATP-binding protein, partial [Commensalibacter sp. Nvir]|uniref:ATP-binding protein n=1 Tax=Commensalibacter sp. Nvir TaxID=3069817 RepID=UPI0030C8839E
MTKPKVPKLLDIKQLSDSFNWDKSYLGKREKWPHDLETLFSLILNTPTPMIIYWGTHYVALYNDAYASLIGSKHPALLGRPFHQIWPERKAHFDKIANAIYRQETIKYVSKYKIPGKNTNNALQQLEVTFSPIYNSNEEIQGLFSIVIETPKYLTHFQKTTEQFIGGLAHDFNNLLGGIVGNLELMKMRIQQNKIDTIDRYIQAAQEATSHASAITHQLLSFSRRQTLVSQIIEPNQIILSLQQNFNTLIHSHLKHSIDFQINLDPSIWCIFCNAEQFKNAILNIFTNACEAINPINGRITISTKNTTVTISHPVRTHLKPNDYIIITIEDNGDGMTEEILNHAVDPFFTTKPLGKRAGLGLSMAYGFAKQSSGDLLIDSVQNHGTCISLFLPKYRQSMLTEKKISYEFNNNKQVSLIVSKDNHLCTWLSENLEDLGYTIIVAQTKHEAITFLKVNPNIKFIIIDAELITKADTILIDKLFLKNPLLPIIFVTGHNNITVYLKKVFDKTHFIIRKPLSYSLLANHIRTIE